MDTSQKKKSVGERTMALKAVPFFTQLSDKELDFVRAAATEKTYPKNAVVLTEGETGDSLYMIQSGKVKVFIGDEEGREIILKILGPGAFFGEMSMIDKQPRSASVTTIEQSTFLVLTHVAFERCVEQAPRIAALVMQCLAQRVREATARSARWPSWTCTGAWRARCWNCPSTATASSSWERSSRSRTSPTWWAPRARW
jgi:CRP/FNR family cyclic AMP-dependent transcriptional regulator